MELVAICISHSKSTVTHQSSGEVGVGVQILPDVNSALHDGVVASLVGTGRIHLEKWRLEESLWTPESIVSNGEDLSVEEFVGLLERYGVGNDLHLPLEVYGDYKRLEHSPGYHYGDKLPTQYDDFTKLWWLIWDMVPVSCKYTGQ